jgi:kynureninase
LPVGRGQLRAAGAGGLHAAAGRDRLVRRVRHPLGKGRRPRGLPHRGARFAGATYDPTSHYRGAEVFDFFTELGLTPALLREVSQHQVGLLAARFDALDLPPELVDRDREVPLQKIGGFLSLRSPRAGELVRGLAARGVSSDHRGDRLRLGPAPYMADSQLEAAMDLLGEAVREVAKP